MVIERSAELPLPLATIPDEMVVEVDVREDLRSGQEPFGRIMAARGMVSEDGALVVRAIFEPVPLYRVLGNQGFVHHTEQMGDEDWRVWFYRPTEEAAAPTVPDEVGGVPEAPGGQDAEAHGEDPVVLDVRGLEPPEPMVRTLAALADLPARGTLLHINVRVPQLLLPLLEERGFTYEIREQQPDLVRVFITRASPSPDPQST